MVDDAKKTRAVGATPPGTIVPKGYVQAKRLVESGAPLVFVSGNAGTGKTTLIHYLRDNITLRNVVVAPTGVAALNAGGLYMNSLTSRLSEVTAEGADVVTN